MILPPGAHHLVTAGEILHRRTPDVNQTGEREDQEDGHPQHQVDAVNPRHAVQMRRGAAVEGDHRLRPVHQLEHFAAVRMLGGEGDRRQPQRALNQQNAQDQNISRGGGGANARVGQAARQQADAAHQGERPAHAAEDHRHQLLLRHRQEPRVDPVRGQHAKEMAEKNAENADMKQVRP